MKMKREKQHVEKTRPNVSQVLRDFKLNMDAEDLAGSSLGLFETVIEKLSHACLDFVWNDDDGLRNLLREILKNLSSALK